MTHLRGGKPGHACHPCRGPSNRKNRQLRPASQPGISCRPAKCRNQSGHRMATGKNHTRIARRVGSCVRIDQSRCQQRCCQRRHPAPCQRGDIQITIRFRTNRENERGHGVTALYISSVCGPWSLLLHCHRQNRTRNAASTTSVRSENAGRQPHQEAGLPASRQAALHRCWPRQSCPDRPDYRPR